MEISGNITKVLPLQTGAKKDGTGDWKKQAFVVVTKEEYNNIYCFELFGDEKVDNFNNYNKVGDAVKVDFNVQTNEYQGKYYTTLQAWKVFKEKAEPSAQPYAPATNYADQEDDGTGLPF